MTIESLQDAIAQERQQRETFDHAGLMPSIDRGERQEVLEEYRDQLRNELEGVEERIKELGAA